MLKEDEMRHLRATSVSTICVGREGSAHHGLNAPCCERGKLLTLNSRFPNHVALVILFCYGKYVKEIETTDVTLSSCRNHVEQKLNTMLSSTFCRIHLFHLIPGRPTPLESQ